MAKWNNKPALRGLLQPKRPLRWSPLISQRTGAPSTRLNPRKSRVDWNHTSCNYIRNCTTSWPSFEFVSWFALDFNSRKIGNTFSMRAVDDFLNKHHHWWLIFWFYCCCVMSWRCSQKKIEDLWMPLGASSDKVYIRYCKQAGIITERPSLLYGALKRAANPGYMPSISPEDAHKSLSAPRMGKWGPKFYDVPSAALF